MVRFGRRFPSGWTTAQWSSVPSASIFSINAASASRSAGRCDVDGERLLMARVRSQCRLHELVNADAALVRLPRLVEASALQMLGPGGLSGLWHALCERPTVAWRKRRGRSVWVACRAARREVPMSRRHRPRARARALAKAPRCSRPQQLQLPLQLQVVLPRRTMPCRWLSSHGRTAW